MRASLVRWTVFLLWGGLVISLLNGGGGLWALKRLEKKAGTHIEASFLPHLFRPAFSLRNCRFGWQNRFRVLSGNIEVRYDPLSLLPGRKLRVHILGTDLKLQLFGDLLESQGLSEAQLDKVDLDFAFSGHGEPEIYQFHVESPELRFNLVEK